MSALMTLFALQTLAAFGQIAPAPVLAPEPTRECRKSELHGVENPQSARPVQKLNREPLANAEKTVMYREGDCILPLIVREQVGAEQR